MMAAEEMEIVVEIVCEALPALQYEGRGPLHLGIQQDSEIVEAAPADRDRITFRPALRLRKQGDGSANLLGPFAHGPRRDGKPREQIGRIKLHLNHIKYEDAEKAAARKKPIKVTLQLTNEKGKPVVASVRANQAKWQL